MIYACDSTCGLRAAAVPFLRLYLCISNAHMYFSAAAYHDYTNYCSKVSVTLVFRFFLDTLRNVRF
jgi:hypothetical protein